MIMAACLINAIVNVINFVTWNQLVKSQKLKAHDAKGYFMILVFVLLLIAFAVGIIDQEQVSTYLILINSAISLIALAMAFVFIKDPIKY